MLTSRNGNDQKPKGGFMHISNNIEKCWPMAGVLPRSSYNQPFLPTPVAWKRPQHQTAKGRLSYNCTAFLHQILNHKQLSSPIPLAPSLLTLGSRFSSQLYFHLGKGSTEAHRTRQCTAKQCQHVSNTQGLAASETRLAFRGHNVTCPWYRYAALHNARSLAARSKRSFSAQTFKNLYLQYCFTGNITAACLCGCIRLSMKQRRPSSQLHCCPSEEPQRSHSHLLLF